MTQTQEMAAARTRTVLAPVSAEWRKSGDGEDYTLTGHAAVFDEWSEDLWTFEGVFRERIAPGAFKDVLRSKPDVRLLYNHDGMTLARTRSGTLELEEDEVGLRVWAKLADTSLARDLRKAMQRGDVDQMSFAFTIAEDEWREDHDTEEIERTILRVDQLYDVSVVSFPAYPDTDAAMREVRSAAEREGITLVARTETDSVGGQAPDPDAEAETDPPAEEEEDDSAAEEPADGDEDTQASEAAERSLALEEAKASLIRLRKETARWEK